MAAMRALLLTLLLLPALVQVQPPLEPIPAPATAATLRPCNASHAKEQGWVLRRGGGWGAANTLVLNTSIAQWRLPHCGFCLQVPSSRPGADDPIVRKAPCCCSNGSWCGRQTCTDPESDRQTFALRPDGRLASPGPGGRCIASSSATVGAALHAVDCESSGSGSGPGATGAAFFLGWVDGMSPALRLISSYSSAAAAAAAGNGAAGSAGSASESAPPGLCLGTGFPPGARPLFHCSSSSDGDDRRCVPGGVRENISLSHFNALNKTIILPRQARDKHREISSTRDAFSAGGARDVHRPRLLRSLQRDVGQQQN
jgi:hypothetical protein